MHSLKLEQQLIQHCRKHGIFYVFLIASLTAVYARVSGFGFQSVDFDSFLNPWYWTMHDMSIHDALATQVGDYNVLYQELILILTRIPVLASLTKYKILSCMFDFGLAAAGAMLIKTLGGSQTKALLGYIALLFLPTVVLNSSVWGQADSMFTMFAVFSLCFLFRRQYRAAFILYGLSFACKLQAIFLFPFFVFMCVKDERSFLNFLWIPASVYFVSLPALLAGRNLLSPILIYAAQTSEYPSISCRALNLWMLFQNQEGLIDGYVPLHKYAICLTFITLGVGYLLMFRRKSDSSLHDLKYAAWCTWACFLFLPSMHDRYQYLCGILLVMIAVVCSDREYCFYALSCELISLCIYGVNLFAVEMTYDTYVILSLLNTALFLNYTYSLFISRSI